MPKKILLADDSITIQKVVELTFSDGDYEVIAVNNGAKAIQKLAEMRPDIILSDIIMPEKNGYEVCEYVKSHPEFRNIPVILLTGTFEPFDPDRADKAGCDAVVTKPFESQSLIHKVEELVESARSQAPTQPPSPSPFSSAGPAQSTPAAPKSEFSTGAFQSHSSDIFSAPSSKDEPSTTSGETKAFPRMSFDDQQKMSEPSTPSSSAPASKGEPSTPSGETRAFPRISFDEPKRSAADEPPPTTPAAETRAFPRMSFEDLQKPSAPSKPIEPSTPFSASPEPPASEKMPWAEPGAFSGETKAFPRMNYDELQQQISSNAPSTPASTSAKGRSDQTPAATSSGGELTDEQIDRIARRVVQMMSDQVVRTIAWEVIPDLAEMVVKERIRQLENE
jgi:CheY-like chemotaxis protein